MTGDRIEALLGALLRSRLGYDKPPSPTRLRDELSALAAERQCDPALLLERVWRTGDPDVLSRLVHAATVPHTSFFRHPEQLDRLVGRLRDMSATGRALRIWCAGCATGEEAYSIAILAERAGVPVRVLGTDVRTSAIEVARRGEYSARRALGVPGADALGGWRAPPNLRASVRFEVASLVDRDPAGTAGTFDAILCRNVLLYFDRDTAASVLATLAGRLARGGSILVAPVESLIPLPEELEPDEAPGFLRHARRQRAEAVAPRARRPAPRPDSRERRSPSVAPPGALDDAARELAAGDFAGAETTLHRVLDREPANSRAWFLLGEALAQRGEINQARAAFEHAARHAESSADEDAGTVVAAARARAGSIAPPAEDE